MVFFCFVDIYPRPSFIFRLIQFFVFWYYHLLFMINHFDVQLLTLLQRYLFIIQYCSFPILAFWYYHSPVLFFFMINHCYVQLLILIYSHLCFVLSYHFEVLLLTFHCCWVTPVCCSLIFFCHVVPNFSFNIVITFVYFFAIWLSFGLVSNFCFKLCHFLIYSSFVVGSGGFDFLLWDLGHCIIHCGIWGILFFIVGSGALLLSMGTGAFYFLFWDLGHFY